MTMLRRMTSDFRDTWDTYASAWAATTLSARRTALESHYATRAQIQRAVPERFSGEREILSAIYPLLELRDDAWWKGLATSNQAKLREIAAANAATPSSTLVTLLRDLEDGVRNLAAGNPSTPLEALDTVRADSTWILANPRLPDTLLRRLLDRALLDDDEDVVYACKQVLAARTLRALP